MSQANARRGHDRLRSLMLVLLAIGGVAIAPAALTANAAGKVIQDCPDCPKVIYIPAGKFMMGALPGEEFPPKEPIDPLSTPRHEVTFAKPFAIGQSEVTRGQFGAFVKATDYQSPRECSLLDRGNALLQGFNWMYPTTPQYSEDEPVLCLSYWDAVSYTSWLTKTTGHRYRLPSEAEWEYAGRAGTTTFYFWGDTPKGGCEYSPAYDLGFVRNRGGDVQGEVSKAMEEGLCDAHKPAYEGSHAPVTMYKANAWGLYGVHSNGWEMVQDCWHQDYTGAPTDGSAWEDDPTCHIRSLRGDGGGLSGWGHIAHRYQNFNDQHRSNTGTFRVARDLEPAEY